MRLFRKLANLLIGLVLVITVFVIDATVVFAGTDFIPFVPVDGSTASGTGNGQFNYPLYAAADSSGNVYVTDSNNNRIQKFDSTGGYVTQWGSSGTGDGQFIGLHGIGVDSSGNVYVTDYINSRIQKFDSNGGYVKQWGGLGYIDGKFDRPAGVAVDSSGNVYVADNCRQCIQKFDSDGNFLAKWGSCGTGDGQFGSPEGIAVDSSGNIYVSDNSNNRIQKFDSNGNFLTKWGGGSDGVSSGTDDGQFKWPYGIAADSSGNVYVVDGGNNRIQKFDSDGNFLAKWGSYGTGIGQLYYPKGIMADSSGNVYIVDYFNQRILVFAPTLEATSTVKGQIITGLGKPSLKLDCVTAGTVTITGEQAADTTCMAPYATLFDKGSANASVKVVKYAAGSDTGSFDTDTAYVGEAVANGDFFIVGLTAAEGTKVAYYKINVTVPPAELTSFTFDGFTPAVTGVVDNTAKTIKLLVPSGTDVTKLAPTIVHTGKSILPASGAEQDFTNSVKYTIVDFNGTSQDYYVTVCTEFGGGDGSEENPYQITRLEHLNNMRNRLDKHFILMNDLDFSLDTDYMDIDNKTMWTSGTGWTPVGTDLSKFTGSFDGGGHTINGLMINSSAKYAGLFGYIASGAEVKNIILESVSIKSSNAGAYVGGLAGTSGGAVTGCGVSGSVTGNYNVGGLIGAVTGTVSNSYSTATVNGITVRGAKYKLGYKGGGLVGLLSGTSAEITGSYSLGSIINFNFAGGLVGDATGSEIRNCYSTANLSGGVNDIGGLVGTADAATISNCYALGSLESYLSCMSDACQGGLIGNVCNAATVEYCYSAGSVTGIHPGGLIGTLDSTGNTLTDSFYDSGTSGCGDTGNGEPKTPTKMRTAGTFAGWDFDTVWDITDTKTHCSYPYLKNNMQSPVPGYAEKVPISAEPQNATVTAGGNTSFTVTATGAGLAYQWQADTGSGFNDIADGGVYSGAKADTLCITGAEAGMNGYAYRAIVTGTEAYPATSDSASLTVKLPGAPVIKSVVPGNKHVLMSWDSVTAATGYKVFSSTTSGSYGTLMETVSGSVYSHDATGLTNGITYYFAVKATCGEVESDYSSQVSATPQVPAPGAPVLQSAVAGDKHVNISWSAVDGATGYKIFSGTTSGDYGDSIATVTDSVYGYDATELINGTTYYFVVIAENPGGDSGYSNEISATPMSVPGAPTDVTAEAGDRQAVISFTAPEDNGGSPITGYIVTANPGGITLSGADTPITVTGLTNGTAYTFTVRAVNAAGTGKESEASSMVIPYRPSDRDDDTEDEDTPVTPVTPTEPAKPSEAGVEILVNGMPETAAASATTTTDGRTVTTVTVDAEKVEEKLQTEGNNAVVTIPVNNDADVVVGQLNGQTVKNMEVKEAVLEIKTGNVTYTLPAAQINIGNVSSQLGEQVELKDIVVNISISAPFQDIVRIIEDTANRNNYQIIVKPVEFNITCTNGNKTVEVSRFNGYVERMVAIPEGVDPGRITTGIVLNSDGTFSHVPTTIIVVNGKYYAKINSLTNSTYSVICSPKTFKDIENHWAKAEVNDMGSRLVIDGTGEDEFEPDRDMTRAEFAAVIVRALGLMRSEMGKDIFNDVTKDDWYYNAVSIAYEYGIISGYGSGEFGPTDKVTREQVMIMIARSMDITGFKTEMTSIEANKLLENFADAGITADYAENSAALSIKAGIVTGRNGKELAPKDNITRAETAVIIRRLLQVSGLI